MRLRNAVRTSAFRLTFLYAVVFAASVLVLLAFLYWRTIALIDRQAHDTIEAEVRGLAEQYEQRGLPGLVELVRQRALVGNGDHVYLLTTPSLLPLAGNLERWPDEKATNGWLSLTLSKMDEGRMTPHPIEARSFLLPGGFHLLVGRDVHERGKFRLIVLEAFAWSLAATLALGMIGGLLLSRRVLGRVEQVAATARRIMAGDLTQRLPRDRSGDEFDRLAAILNGMLDRIERLMGGMRLATDSLAHDLRSPLTRLKARVELALLQRPDAERDRRALGDVLEQADSALLLFESLLKIAMAESGASATELKPLDLAALTRDAAELYEPLAEDNGIILRVAADHPAMIRGQGELLAQSIANLLDNAVKYTPAGGVIDVSVTAHGQEQVTLSIADNGPGIGAADRQRVLERFVRLEESRSTPGSGLGLSLVDAVARLHGAGLSLDDGNPGLRVTLVFPYAVGEAAAPPTTGRSLSPPPTAEIALRPLTEAVGESPRTPG
ncbi:MAG: HAMP domain-containing sensor histidine kinase [Rhodospirillales bacterium]